MDGHLRVIHMVTLILKTSLEGIKRDTKRWKDEVEPIVGKTDMFVFPHGAQDRHTQAYDYLVDEAEFKFIAGVGPNNFTDISATNVYQDRVAIDGLNLFEFKYKLKPFLILKMYIVNKIDVTLKGIGIMKNS